MFKTSTGEGRGEEAAAASADTERPEKLSYCSEAFERNCGKTAEKVLVGVKTPTSTTDATPLSGGDGSGSL